MLKFVAAESLDEQEETGSQIKRLKNLSFVFRYEGSDVRVDLADDECIYVEQLTQPLHWQVASHRAICKLDVS